MAFLPPHCDCGLRASPGIDEVFVEMGAGQKRFAQVSVRPLIAAADSTNATPIDQIEPHNIHTIIDTFTGEHSNRSSASRSGGVKDT
jgi:hypothetical protein